MKPAYLHPVEETRPDGTVERYGFEWGPVRVVRLAHVPGRGWWLVVQTKHDEMTIRVSHGGNRISVEVP